MISDNIKAFNVIDEKVLEVLESIPRDNFVPELLKSFAYLEYEMPISNKQHMLLPSIEAQILQSLNIKSNESVLVIGSGTGYLSSCVALLAKNVVSIDIYEEFIDLAKDNIHKLNTVKNLSFIKKNITSEWNLLDKYDVVLSTASTESDKDIISNLGDDTRAFVFIGPDNSPVKNGLLIHKYKNESVIKEYILETNISPLLKDKQ